MNGDRSNATQARRADRRRDTYAAAVQTFGKHAQIILAMEEMSELTKELSKNIRGRENTAAISEEMADVEIMLEQLKTIFGNRAEVDRIRADKLRRLADLLERESANESLHEGETV